MNNLKGNKQSYIITVDDLYINTVRRITPLMISEGAGCTKQRRVAYNRLQIPTYPCPQCQGGGCPYCSGYGEIDTRE